MKASTALKDQAARFVRLFVVAFIAALAPAAIALKGPVDVKVVEAVVAGAAVGAAETAWRQLRPTVPAGSLVDVVQGALSQAQQRATDAQAELARIQAVVTRVPAAISQPDPVGTPIAAPTQAAPIQL